MRHVRARPGRRPVGRDGHRPRARRHGRLCRRVLLVHGEAVRVARRRRLGRVRVLRREHVPNPSYDEVSRKTTGHTEVVEVVYNPSVVPYDTLLQVYWHNVDPLDDGGQFCDRGSPYRPVIFVRTPAERAAAEATKAQLAERFGEPVKVPVQDAAPFYAAEDYPPGLLPHQPRPLQQLPRRVPPRRAPGRAVGRCRRPPRPRPLTLRRHEDARSRPAGGRHARRARLRRPARRARAVR